MKEPEKVITIALDDLMPALENVLSATLVGQMKDELKKRIPNMLKDEKLRVRYDPNNVSQHIFILDPQHPVTVTRISKEEL